MSQQQIDTQQVAPAVDSALRKWNLALEIYTMIFLVVGLTSCLLMARFVWSYPQEPFPLKTFSTCIGGFLLAMTVRHIAQNWITRRYGSHA